MVHTDRARGGILKMTGIHYRHHQNVDNIQNAIMIDDMKIHEGSIETVLQIYLRVKGVQHGQGLVRQVQVTEGEVTIMTAIESATDSVIETYKGPRAIGTQIRRLEREKEELQQQTKAFRLEQIQPYQSSRAAGLPPHHLLDPLRKVARLTNPEIARFGRQLILPGFGMKGESL
ncbi:hypothetical protein BGX27_002530 [Mortierella sp. AM989]|nr:hypothetical protein BGX27_002530 [Mortierella sp. AM989]